MTERLMKQELQKAEAAGEKALESLYILRDTLNSAKRRKEIRKYNLNKQ